MSRQMIKSLGDGATVDEVFVALDKQLRANRNGNSYLQMELRDRTGSMAARQWNANESTFRCFEEGDFLHVKGKVQLFQGTLQMIVNSFEKISPNDVDLSEFLPHTEQDISKLFEKVRNFLRKMTNPHLRALAESFFMDEELMQAFCKVPRE